ncbi:two-component system response regulator FixJ [Gellertiella hungarica]|uniref:Two-component system response regulator FixJ n=2 Tax=Gellertiella hungarica TaxID=1572859 RepID=A0A7W6NM53_9HYPH|nr:two-component system response regulator FixJ [Gellertiella hungarica]
MEMADFTVHLVDDEETVRKSLAFMLTMNDFSVRVHESATQFLKVAPQLKAAVLVTDLRMPDMSGVQLIQQVNALKLKIPAIVMTGHGDVPMAVEAMKAGAVDFIEKPFEDEVMMGAIRAAAAQITPDGESGDDADIVLERLASLTDRERQVFAAVVSGLPNKSIAYDLDISPRTVEVHRANVMSKMQARSLPQLVRMALAAGISAS